MLKSIKKNQVVIYVIALMLVAAGYLNYSSEDKSIEASADPELIYNESLADIGDATLVSSNVVEENVTDSSALSSENQTESNTTNTAEQETAEQANEESVQEENLEGATSEETQETATAVSTDEYFSKSKLERDTMYSQMLETYQNIVNSNTVSEEQRAIATQEITNINNTKNAIMICENLLGTKGFENSVVFVNGTSVSVVVKAGGELETSQVAQIQNIVSREMGVEVPNINITQKN